MEIFSLYLVVFFSVYIIFRFVKRNENPFKKIWFWVTVAIVELLFTVGFGLLVLFAIGGGRPDYKEGFNREYFRNGKLKNEFFVKDKVIQGYDKEWDSTGCLIKNEKFVDGYVQDTTIKYYSNGKMESFQIYHKNELIASRWWYYENERIREEAYFNKEAKKYYPTGVLSQKQGLKGWMIEGIETAYYSNGNIKYSGIVKENGKNGKWFLFDSITGQKIDSDKFDYRKYRDVKQNWK